MRRHSGALSTADLLALALRHYRLEIRERVTRYKQGFLVFALLALPGLPEFKAFVLAPLQNVFAQDPSAGPAAAGYLLAVGLWAALQRGAVGSSSAVAMMESLPIPRWRVLLRDAMLLSIVSFPFTLLLVIAAASAPSAAGPIERAVSALLVIALALTGQLAVLRGRYLIALVVLGTTVLTNSDGRLGTLVIAGIAVFLASVWLCRWPPLTQDYRRRSLGRRSMSRLTKSCSTSLVAMQWFGLYKGRHGAYRLTLAVVACIGVLVGLLLSTVPGSPSRAVGLAVAYAALSTGLLGLGFGTVFDQQRVYAALLDPLPVSRPQRALQAIVAVEGPAVLFAGGLAAVVARSGLHYGVLVVTCALLLSSVQYMVYRNWPRHAIAAGLLSSVVLVVATAWMVSAWMS